LPPGRIPGSGWPHQHVARQYVPCPQDVCLPSGVCVCVRVRAGVHVCERGCGCGCGCGCVRERRAKCFSGGQWNLGGEQVRARRFGFMCVCMCLCVHERACTRAFRPVVSLGPQPGSAFKRALAKMSHFFPCNYSCYCTVASIGVCL